MSDQHDLHKLESTRKHVVSPALLRCEKASSTSLVACQKNLS